MDVQCNFLKNRMLFTRTAYTFTDKPQSVTCELRSADRVDSVKVSNVYSGVNDALLYTDISYNGGESHRVSSFGYDLLGRPSSKTLPGNAGTVAYSYNVRGWLTGISGKGYSEDIYYNSGNGTPLYNGNISSIIWRDSTQTASRGYKFTYDSMNRLTDAVYGEGPSLSDNTDRYSERGMTYTKNGALTRLLRYGRRNTDDFGLIDSLVMTLDGNRVLSVEDGAGRLVYENSFDFKSNGGSSVYEYDGNGSLSVDPYKGFAFEYDLLGNLKRTESEYTTSYVYSSTGERLSVESKFNGCIAKPHKFFFSDWEEDGVVFNSTSDDSGDSDIMDRWSKMMYPRDTEFCGPFIFEYSVLDKFLFDGGYSTFKDGQASFHYYLQDHLGNNRAVVSEAGTVEQTTEYYPFGGIYGDVSTNSGLQPYKYNGKEFDHYLGLDLYDYGARLYDPALVVWTGVDPLADEYGGISPYVYCHNNPVNAIDPDGKKVIPIRFIGSGEVTYYRSPLQFQKAMIAFGKTSFGRQILADFTPKDKYIYGVRGNGKYADYNLVIEEIDYTNSKEQFLHFNKNPYNTINATTEMLNVDGKPAFYVQFNVQRTQEELTETVSHEFTVHLSDYNDIIKAYEKEMRYSDAKRLWNSVPESKQHNDMVNKKYKYKGTYNYYKTSEELKKQNPQLEKVFEDAYEYNKKHY